MTLACWTICYLSAAVFAAIGLHEPPAEQLADAPDSSSRRAFQHVRTMIEASPGGLSRDRRGPGLPRALGLDGLLADNTIGSDAAVKWRHAGNREHRSANQRCKAGAQGRAPDGSLRFGTECPGHSDDGSGTATLLETLPALKAGPTPKRDIIALFTDAEEVGFIGARVFVGQARRGIGEGHPWMADVGLVLNIEA